MNRAGPNIMEAKSKHSEERANEDDTKNFYSILKYPGPNALVSTVWSKRIAPFLQSGEFEFLDAGCGSGQHSAGILKTYSNARGVGVDISQPSLAEARALIKTLGFQKRMEFVETSFSTPLPFSPRFDVALAVGTIHHSPNPLESLKNIVSILRSGGILAGMVYSQRAHQRRYEVKEMLGILSDGDLETAKALLASYKGKYEGILDVPLRVILSDWRKKISLLRHRLLGRASQYGYVIRPKEDVFFQDAYLSPIDVAFSSKELKYLFDESGLELIEMFTLGRTEAKHLPLNWRDRWAKLNQWDRVRVSELIDPLPVSFSFIARKI